MRIVAPLIIIVSFLLSSISEITDQSAAKIVSSPVVPALAQQDREEIAIPVLMFHYIHPPGEEARSYWSISYEQFAAQMEWFSQNGYSTITTDELHRFIATGEIENPRSFLPIFDDNWYESVKERVLPLMRKYGFTATLALYTNGIYDKADRAFTWEELRQWEAEGVVDVQSHSVSHPLIPSLTQLNAEKLRRELVESKSLIEKNLGKTVIGFVTPGGSLDQRVLNAARDAGYKVFYLLNEKEGVHYDQDPMLIYRFNMVKTLTFEAFVAKMIKYSTPVVVRQEGEPTLPGQRRKCFAPDECVVIEIGKRPATAKPSVEGSILESCQIVAFYGQPNTYKMGVLGEYPIEELVPKLLELTAQYDALNGEKCIIPAFHIVFGTVWPGGEIGILGEAKLMEYINYAEKHGMLIILDHQLGKYEVTEAVAKMLPYLKFKSVHLAIDPEWHTDKPAIEIGHVTGEEINAAQALIQAYLEENGIPGKKILIVHQFTPVMIRNREAIRTDFSRIDLVHDADGFGSPAVKRGEYAYNAKAENMPLKGFKLFFQRPWRNWGYDNPLLTPAEVLALEPKPVLIIYQ